MKSNHLHENRDQQLNQWLPQVCLKYNQRSGCPRNNCPSLHICMFYLGQSCEFGANCRRLHSLSHTDRGKAERRGFDVSDRSFWDKLKDEVSEEVERLKSKRDVSVPHICLFYNSFKCRKGNDCEFVHICKYFVNARCKFGGRCSLSHSLEQKDVRNLELKGLILPSQDATDEYLKLKRESQSETYRSSLQSDSSFQGVNTRLQDESDPAMTSVYSVKHMYQKGVWRYRSNLMNYWVSLNPCASSKIEEDFPDPQKSSSFTVINGVQIGIDFDSMTIIGNPNFALQRMSPVDRIPGAWGWYLEYNPDNWVEFGSLFDEGCVTSIDSVTIEQSLSKVFIGSNLVMRFTISRQFGAAEHFKLVVQNFGTSISKMFAISSGGILKRVRRRAKLIAMLEKVNSRNELCKFHAVKPCLSAKCPLFLYEKADFLWIWKETKSSQWNHFSSQVCQKLERAFSHPHVKSYNAGLTDNSGIILKIYFDDVNHSFVVDPSRYEVKRLNYSQGTSKSNTFVWYWNEDNIVKTSNNSPFDELFDLIYDDRQRWVPFGCLGDSRAKSSVGSDEIEASFRNENFSSIKFSLIFHDGTIVEDFELDLKNCLQTSPKGERRLVRRRIKYDDDSKPSNPGASFLPSFWKSSRRADGILLITPKDEDGYILLNIFRSIFPESESVAMYRLIEKSLWHDYITAKHQLELTFQSDSSLRVFEEKVLFCYPKESTGLDSIEEVVAGEHDISRVLFEWSLVTNDRLFDSTSDFQTAVLSQKGEKKAVVLAFQLSSACETNEQSTQGTSSETLRKNPMLYPAYIISISASKS